MNGAMEGLLGQVKPVGYGGSLQHHDRRYELKLDRLRSSDLGLRADEPVLGALRPSERFSLVSLEKLLPHVPLRFRFAKPSAADDESSGSRRERWDGFSEQAGVTLSLPAPWDWLESGFMSGLIRFFPPAQGAEEHIVRHAREGDHLGQTVEMPSFGIEF